MEMGYCRVCSAQESIVQGGGLVAEMIGYRLWLKLRVGKSLATTESKLAASLAGRSVTIESDRRLQPLRDASWLIMGCRGFESAEQAREFGEELRRAAHLAGLCARVGVDAGDPGDDRTKSSFNPDILDSARELNPDVRLGPDMHGIVVQPDDENTVFFRARGSGRALPNADGFVEALEESLPESNAAPSGSASIRRAIRVMNLAEMNKESIAKVVLAISTIEGLANDPPWTERQKKLIEDAAAWVERSHGELEEAAQVIKAIRQVRQESIRQRVRRLLVANELSDLWREWDDLYARRSRLFHDRSEVGDEHRGEHLEETDLHDLGQKAVNLCARIVLSIAKREGVAVPRRAASHFGVK